MRCLIALLALVAAASAASINAAEWLSFKAEHGKEYETIEEEEKRLQIFIQNRDYINKHNEEAANGEHSYELGMNQLGDLTNEEINARNGFLMKEHKQGEIAEFNNVGDLPKSVDWRTKGYVTPVKDQGNCGSCWAFSATGSLEGQWLKKDQKLISLSEQNLVDCSGKQGNLGCRGGLMDYAFTYIKANDGIDTETSYPYKAKNGKCVFKKESVGAKDTGFKDIKQGSEADLQNAIATVGPISIAMDASRTSFHFYKKGIYDDKRCSSSRLDHGILAVGYDATEGGDKYYIVKNSWGTSWGQKGYFWLARDDHNRCGCATAASYPTE